MNPRPSVVFAWLSPYLLAAVCTVVLVLLLNASWPHVGFDFSYFLPRLLDVRLHQLQEGWFAIQWWTPSFGAGLPGFANPQHTQFMPAQAFVGLLGPWNAAVAQAALCLAGGVLLLFSAARHRLECSLGASLVAAAAWGTNAFFWDHALTGHVGFNSFPLIAMLPHALHARVSPLRATALLGLTGAFIIFSGGYTVIVVFALSGLLLAWLLPLLRPDSFTAPSALLRLTVGGVAALAGSGAKIVASSSFLAQFPRLADYSLAGSIWKAPVALFAQLFVSPSVAIASRWLPLSPDKFKASVGDDVGFSPIVLLLLTIAGAVWLFQPRASGKPRFVLWVGLAFSLWLTSEVALGRGLFWPYLKPLPFLRSLHENDRFTAAFALPIALLLAPAVQFVVAKMRPNVGQFAVGISLLLCFLPLEPRWRDRAGFWTSGFDVTTLQQTWEQLQIHPSERFPVERIADVRDDAVFLAHASSWKPYEPIFGYGYGGSEFRVRLQPGLVEPVANSEGAWRFHDPVAFVSPTLAKSEPFAPIAASKHEALQQLLGRHQPAWPLPLLQHTADLISLVALIGMAAAALLDPWSRSRSRVRFSATAPTAVVLP